MRLPCQQAGWQRGPAEAAATASAAVTPSPPPDSAGGEAAGSHDRWQRPALPDVFTCEIKSSTTAILATLKGKEEATQGPYRRRIILNAVVVRVLIVDRICGWCLFFCLVHVLLLNLSHVSLVHVCTDLDRMNIVLDECALMNVLNIVLDVTMWRGSWDVDRFWIRLDSSWSFFVFFFWLVQTQRCRFYFTYRCRWHVLVPSNW